MGDIGHCCIILRFSAMDRETNLLDRLYPEIQQLRYAYRSLISFLKSLFLFERINIIFIYISGGEFEAIRPLIHAEIKQEESSLSLDAKSNNPALLGEWLPITISLTANENVNAVCLYVILVSDGNEQSSEFSHFYFYFFVIF